MNDQRDDLIRRLEEAGRTPVPAPRAEFADDLERRLRSAGPRATGAPRAVPRLLVAASVAAMVAVAVLAATLAGGDDVEAAATMLAAVDAEVVHPDGTVEAGSPGLKLPDGALVRTGRHGRAVVGTVSLGPDESGLVLDGELQPLRARGGDDDGNDGGDAASPPADAAGTTSTTSGPATTEPGQTTTTTTPAAVDRTTTTTAAPAATGPRPTLRLVARRSLDGTVGLAWSPYEGDHFYAYLVLRAEAPEEPEYPPSRHTTRIVWVARERDATRATDRAEPKTHPVYRVVAVDENGRELARSAAVMPESGSTLR